MSMKIPDFNNEETYVSHSSMTFGNLKRTEESKSV